VNIKKINTWIRKLYDFMEESQICFESWKCCNIRQKVIENTTRLSKIQNENQGILAIFYIT